MYELPKNLAEEMEKEDYEWGFMGQFPEIKYTWATLDSNFYLFNYGGTTKSIKDHKKMLNIVKINEDRFKKKILNKILLHILISIKLYYQLA